MEDTEGEGTLRKPRQSWQANINTILIFQWTGWNGVEWVHVARDMESWWSLVECSNKILVLVKFLEFIDLRRN